MFGSFRFGQGLDGFIAEHRDDLLFLGAGCAEFRGGADLEAMALGGQNVHVGLPFIVGELDARFHVSEALPDAAHEGEAFELHELEAHKMIRLAVHQGLHVAVTRVADLVDVEKQIVELLLAVGEYELVGWVHLVLAKDRLGFDQLLQVQPAIAAGGIRCHVVDRHDLRRRKRYCDRSSLSSVAISAQRGDDHVIALAKICHRHRIHGFARRQDDFA